MLTRKQSVDQASVSTATNDAHRVHKSIGVNRPAFGGTVPHFHQMSRGPAKSADVPHFSKMVLLFFPLPIRPYSTCLPRNATKWRTSNKDRWRSVQNSHADRPLIINTLYYRSVRQMPSILHARQPSPTTVYFVNAATPASSVNTATVVFTATLEYNTTHSRPYSAAAKWRSQLTVVNVNCMCISFSCFVSRKTCSSLNML